MKDKACKSWTLRDIVLWESLVRHCIAALMKIIIFPFRMTSICIHSGFEISHNFQLIFVLRLLSWRIKLTCPYITGCTMQTRQELTCEFSSSAHDSNNISIHIFAATSSSAYRPITAEESLRGSCSSVQTPRSSERGRTGIKRDENKRLPDSFMQLHWDQGQQAYRTLKGSCYSECRCEVCDTFCHIMWRLLEIRARVYRLPGGSFALKGLRASVEGK